MDPAHSRTGVFYQAMPAIGADGKNIMKLIPVQMVNGRFFKTPISEHKTDPTPQKDFTKTAASALSVMAKKAALNLSASQQMINKKVSLLNVFPCPADSVLNDSVNKQPLQQQTVRSMTKAPQTAAHLGTSVRLPCQLPVTVKSPALPRGQCLQSPPTAQVQRVPASQLPPGIKEQIFTSSASSSAGSGSPSVVYVSPVATVDQGVPEPSGPAPRTLKLLSKTSNTTSRGLPPRGAKPHLKLIPKVSQRPNSPTRWVIEEVDGSAPLAVSEFVRSVSERENAQWSLRKDAPGQENALVVCNGKVFFVANKCGSSIKSTAATKSSEIIKTIVPGSAAPQSKQNLGTPGESSEVIDLCDDDDAQDDFPHLDEDNVIFVSYIPPKPECGSAPQSMLETQLELVEQTDSSSTTDDSAQSPSEKQDTRDGGSGGKSQRSTSSQQEDNMEAEAETGSPAGCGRGGEHAHKEESSKHPLSMWTSPPAPEPRQRSDHLLRQIFGITADVKICLLKIDEAAAGCVSAAPTRSAEDDEKPTSGLKEKELSSQDLYGPKEPDVHSGLVSVQSVKVLSEHERLASPLTNVTPLKSSHFKLNSEPPSALKNCCLAQSSLSRTSHAEPEPVIGYVEPIDEDFPDENDIPESQDAAAHPQAQTCVDMNTNTRRLGRTRKRTMCPCCIPAALHPAAKSSGRLEEPERWTLTTEQTGKKAGRTKTTRKDGRAAGRISCLASKNKQNCKSHEAPAGDGLSSDYDELKGHEQTERLADLLNEKDAQIGHTVS